MEGWIKLHRKFNQWEWRDSPKTVSLFIHLLLSANHEDKKWRGILVKRGQLITSLSHLSRDINVSVKSVRVGLNNLKRTNEVAIETTSRYSLIELLNWDKYQVEGTPEGNQGANEGQTKGNKQEGKEHKNEKNSIYTSSFEKFWNVYPVKGGKKIAFGIWKRQHIGEVVEEIVEFVDKAKGTRQWKEGFIPHPTTFLNGHRWEDDLSAYGKQREVVSVK